MDLDVAISTYRATSRFASIKTGRLSNKLSPGHIQVNTTWSQRDLERKENITFTKNYFVQLDVVLSSPPQELAKLEWNVESPSGKFTAVVKTVPQKDGEGKQYIEVWSDDLRLYNISVDALDQHGKIYGNGDFGCLEWSQSETHLLYVAEKKKPKSKSYFEPTSSSEEPKPDTVRGDEFVYRDDWGEQYTGKVQSMVCVLDIESQAVSVLDNLPDDVSAGQAIWCADDLGIICVGTYHGPFRLGRIYCGQRRSALFHIDLKTFKCEILGQSDAAVTSPRFSLDKSRFVFLEQDYGGPHQNCSRLKMCDWSTKGIVTVKEVVRDIKVPSEFPGLFLQHLDIACWANDNKRVVVATQWRSQKVLVVIHCETGEVTRITQDAEVGTWSLLDINNDIILAACSSPSQPHYLVLGNLPCAGQESSIKWTKLDETDPIDTIQWEIHNVDGKSFHDKKTFSNTNYEYILMKSSTLSPDSKHPMVVFPHGGPHAVFSADFMLYPAVLCQLGYIVVAVNYRGSYGFGQDCIESLPGLCGSQDVCDVQSAAERVSETELVDKSRTVVMGGSHGGFLTAHLIGQYPDYYKAAVMRNPVTNMASMMGSTDIPDWCYVEIGENYTDKQKLGSPDVYNKAWEKSPIRYIEKVKAAVLLCIGQNDRRVPTSQAHEYRRALSVLGVTVKLLAYPDNSHPIIKVDSEADCFINIYKWFSEHTN